MPGVTPSQTIGPFFNVMRKLGGSELVARSHPEALEIRGKVFDGNGEAVREALIEIWQADAEGRYSHPDDPRFEELEPGAFGGWGRCLTDSEGGFCFVTIKPGPVPGPDERNQAPHIVVSVFARGLLKHLVTRIYFPDEARLNANDPVLSSIAEAEVRETLIAQDSGAGSFRFDIHLRGPKETAFFAV
jgi:protocatechuate 3,4-dioxygenase alpha subunit